MLNSMVYQETFAPVTRYDTIRLLFVLVAQNSWHIHKLDVKSAFLNGFVDEEIYVEQPLWLQAKRTMCTF